MHPCKFPCLQIKVTTEVRSLRRWLHLIVYRTTLFVTKAGSKKNGPRELSQVTYSSSVQFSLNGLSFVLLCSVRLKSSKVFLKEAGSLAKAVGVSQLCKQVTEALAMTM